MSSGSGLVSDVVDAVVLLVRLAVGVDHRGLITFTGEAIFLEVPFLLAVPALGVLITEGRRMIVVTLVVAVVAVAVVTVAIAIVSAEANCGEMSELIVG